MEEKSTLNFIIVAVIIAGGVALLVFICTVRRNIHPLHRALALTSTLPVARAYDFQMHCYQFDKIHVRVPSFTVYVWFFVLVALTIWKLVKTAQTLYQAMVRSSQAIKTYACRERMEYTKIVLEISTPSEAVFFKLGKLEGRPTECVMQTATLALRAVSRGFSTYHLELQWGQTEIIMANRHCTQILPLF